MKIKKLLFLGTVFAMAATPVFAADADKKTDGGTPPVEFEKAPVEHHGGWFSRHFGSRHGDGNEMRRDCPFCGEMRSEGKPGKDHDCRNEKDRKGGKDKKDRKHMKNMPEMFPGFQGVPNGIMPGMKNLRKISDDEILDMVKEADSSFAKKLKEMKKDNPKKYKRAVSSLKMKFFFLKDKKTDRDKEMIRKTVASLSLETEVRELVEKYRAAEPEKKAEVKSELKAGLEKLFDLRIEEQRSRIQRMEEAIADQKKKLDERKGAKDRIVESRLDEMTGEGFRW